ncbi:rRNA maturation RNase YbeY [Halothermothrix orenii]|uniref:Endoribonuclease YbeY n=1 Tax=Halothermothrix orenii (strain H 168 / OCM 544 / DSM 9562) TaxID=373903 RepID=B8CXI9_HALOH|nr:rRNA maturation RNase YbeY [Halothermothrix orenii]ACL70008.1 conserved hypothetical protein TIGR00043 [Halothermothrix orenii H 168]
MVKVEINDNQGITGSNNDIKQLIETVINKTAEVEKASGTVSVALVDNKTIAELNSKYRNVEGPTDVLSFPMDEDILGDIIISIDRARQQADEYGHSLERELGFLTVHGMLHLLGYNHKTDEEKCVMRQKEERVLKELELYRD